MLQLYNSREELEWKLWISWSHSFRKNRDTCSVWTELENSLRCIKPKCLPAGGYQSSCCHNNMGSVGLFCGHNIGSLGKTSWVILPCQGCIVGAWNTQSSQLHNETFQTPKHGVCSTINQRLHFELESLISTVRNSIYTLYHSITQQLHALHINS